MLAGYCWPQSGRGGDAISLFMSGEGDCSVRVVRVGSQEREVAHFVCAALPQPIPDDAASAGCRWQAAQTIDIDAEWASGFYRVDLATGDETAEAFFVVKADLGDHAYDGVLVLSTSTWAAYNNWGGHSFYTGGNTSSQHRPLPRGFLKKDDPRRFRTARYIDFTDEDNEVMRTQRISPWSMPAGWANWEQLFVAWAETEGLRLAYGVSHDLAEDEVLLAHTDLYISVGHDEYWSAAMRDRVESFIDAGGHAAFFSGNTSFWHARYEGEAWVSYKMDLEGDPMYDPDSAPALSTMWSDPLVGRPENHMTGVSFTRGGYAHMPNSPRGSGGYDIHRPEHWVFDGISNTDADLGAASIVVGYECDGCEFEIVDGLPQPTGYDGTPTHFQILATAPARLWENHHITGLRDDYVGELNWVTQRIEGEDSVENIERYGNGHAVLGIMTKGSGQVFTTGCTDWAYGLDDPDIAQVTRNVLREFAGSRDSS